MRLLILVALCLSKQLISKSGAAVGFFSVLQGRACALIGNASLHYNSCPAVSRLRHIFLTCGAFLSAGPLVVISGPTRVPDLLLTVDDLLSERLLLLVFILPLAPLRIGRAVIILVVTVDATFICTSVVRCAALVLSPGRTILMLLVVACVLDHVAGDHRRVVALLAPVCLGTLRFHFHFVRGLNYEVFVDDFHGAISLDFIVLHQAHADLLLAALR